MATIAEMRTMLQDRGYAVDTNNQQDRLLERAYNQLQNIRRWDWQVVKYAFVVNPGVAFLSNISIDAVVGRPYRTVESFRLATPGIDDPTYLTLDRYEELTSSQSWEMERGNPQYWTRTNDGILWTPAVAKQTTVELTLITRLPTFATISAGNVPLPDELIEWVVAKACQFLAYRERDYDSYNMVRSEADEIMASYLGQHGIKQRQSSGRVEDSGYNSRFDDPWWLV